LRGPGLLSISSLCVTLWGAKLAVPWLFAKFGSQIARCGIHVAETNGAQTLRLSLIANEVNVRRRQKRMKQVRHILMAVIIGAMACVGGFAQRGRNDNRPPKENPKIVDKDKEKPPPSNSNQGGRRKP
jgi:hypothetical protein